MSKQRKPKPKRGPSVWFLEVTRRLRISWTLSRLKSLKKKHQKETLRLHQMQVRQDAQLLLLLQLEQYQVLAQIRHQELLGSSRYRLQGELTQEPETPGLDQLLGISSPPAQASAMSISSTSSLPSGK